MEITIVFNVKRETIKQKTFKKFIRNQIDDKDRLSE